MVATNAFGMGINKPCLLYTSSLGFSGPGLILPDTTYYNDEHPRKKELLDFWAKNTSEILKTFDVENAEEIAKSALKFDALLVPSANTSEAVSYTHLDVYKRQVPL